MRTVAASLAAWALMLPLAAAFGAEKEGANSTVITAEDIRRERPANVKDLLRTRAGVDDSSGAITLRGVQGVAVVLDGLPSSLTEIGQLNLEDLERIEILRGAASARFGANVMGGAIVVTTRRRAARPLLTLLGGSTGSLGLRFSGETSLDPWQLGMTLKDEHEQGTRRVPVAPYPQQITVAPERYRRQGVTLRAGYRRDAASLGLELKHADNLDRYGRPHWWARYRSSSGRMTAETPLAHGIVLEGVAGREHYDNLGLRDTGTGIDAAGLAPDRHMASAGDKTDVDLAVAWRGELTGLRLGTAYRREQDRFSIRPHAGGGDMFVLDAETVNRAVFVHLDRRFGALEAAFDGRLDRHGYPAISLYHAASDTPAPAAGVVKQSFNPKLDLRWRVAQGVSLNASAGTGFVPPSPYQLYYSDTGSSAWMLGNPALKPQRSLTRDVGLSLQRGDRWSVAASLFHTAWTDKIGITIIDYGTPLKRQFANIGAAAASGLELESRLRLAGAWSASLNYTFNRTRIVRNQSHPERVGNALPDMPRHKLNAALAYESPGISGRLSVRAVSAAFTDEANTVIDARGYHWEKSAYAVVDAAVTRRFRDTDLTVAVDNLFDRGYTTGFFRLGQPRLLRLELAWRL